MTITTRLFKDRNFENLRFIDAGPGPTQRYSNITKRDLEAFGAHDNISSYKLECAEDDTGATIIFYEHRADVTYGDNPPSNRFDAFTCTAGSSIELDRLPGGQEDRTTQVLIVRRAPARETSFYLSNNFLWQNREIIFGSVLDRVDPTLASKLQYTVARVVPGPSVAIDRVLLGFAFGFDGLSLPIVRDIDADGEILVDVTVQDAGLKATYAGYRFDADGFRPIRKAVERMFDSTLNRADIQNDISRTLTGLLAAFFAGGNHVYLMPGDARSHTPSSPVTGNVKDSGASIVMVK